MRFSGTFNFPFSQIPDYASNAKNPKKATEDAANKALLRSRHQQLKQIITFQNFDNAPVLALLAKDHVGIGIPYANGYDSYRSHIFQVTRAPKHDKAHTQFSFKWKNKPAHLVEMKLVYPQFVDAADNAFKQRLSENGFEEGTHYRYEPNEDNTVSVEKTREERRKDLSLV